MVMQFGVGIGRCAANQRAFRHTVLRQGLPFQAFRRKASARLERLGRNQYIHCGLGLGCGRAA